MGATAGFLTGGAAHALATPTDLDPSFADAGILDTGSVRVLDVEVQSSGRVIIARSDGSVEALTESGGLDPSFAGGGRIADAGLTVGAIALDDLDRLYLAGTFAEPFVSRFLPDGTPDASFGDGGSVRAPSPLFSELAAGPDGHVVGASERSVTRFTPDGELDTDFSGDGTLAYAEMGFPNQTTPVINRQDPIFYDLAVDPSGRIILAGARIPTDRGGAGPPSGLLMAVTQDGELDDSFATAGKLVFRSFAQFRAVLALPDGRIAAVLDGDGNLGGSTLAQFEGDGTFDAESESSYGYAFSPTAMSRQADGKLLVAGRVNDSAAVIRHEPNGGADLGFSSTGPVPIAGTDVVSPTAVLADPSGRVLISAAADHPEAGLVAALIGDSVPPDDPDPPVDPPADPPADPGTGADGEGGTAGSEFSFRVLGRSVPKSLSRLAANGAKARARCSADCRIFVRLVVSRRQAALLGLGSRVIGRGAVNARAGRPTAVRAWLFAKPQRKLLAADPGVVLIKVGVSASPD